MATLKDAKIGQTVTVRKLTGEGAVKRRIMDMGITKGTEIYIRKVAPLGDPIERSPCADMSFRCARLMQKWWRYDLDKAIMQWRGFLEACTPYCLHKQYVIQLE